MKDVQRIQELFGDKVTSIPEISKTLELSEDVVTNAVIYLKAHEKAIGWYHNGSSIYIYPAA